MKVNKTLPFVFSINSISSEIFLYSSRVRLLDTDTRIIARHDVDAFVFIDAAIFATKTVETRTDVVEQTIDTYPVVAWHWTAVPCGLAPVNIFLTRFPFVTTGTHAFVVVNLKCKPRNSFTQDLSFWPSSKSWHNFHEWAKRLWRI